MKVSKFIKQFKINNSIFHIAVHISKINHFTKRRYNSSLKYSHYINKFKEIDIVIYWRILWYKE